MAAKTFTQASAELSYLQEMARPNWESMSDEDRAAITTKAAVVTLRSMIFQLMGTPGAADELAGLVGEEEFVWLAGVIA
jgi:hypothetical protein